MSDVSTIKKRIYDEGKIEDLLEALGCENIRVEGRGARYVAQLPARFNSDNRRSVQVYNDEALISYIRSRNIAGDIFTLVGYVQFDYDARDDVRHHFIVIKNWICQALGYNEYMGFGQGDTSFEIDWNAWLRPIQKARPREFEFAENDIIDEAVFGQYIKIPHMKWVNEGVSPRTQVEFGVHVDIESERIVFPVCNKQGQLIGIKGRYFGSDSTVEEDFKYLPLYPYSKGIELFNLHRALPHIKDRNEVLVVEAAKSCMVLTQWGYKNCVSLEGKNMTSHQAKMLRQLKVPIVFAWDKDVSVKEIKQQTQDFKTRLVYCIYDTKNYLENHDSPIDKGRKVWDTIYNGHRYKL